MKIFNFLSKIATVYKIWSQKFKFFLNEKKYIFFNFLFIDWFILGGGLGVGEELSIIKAIRFRIYEF